MKAIRYGDGRSSVSRRFRIELTVEQNALRVDRRALRRLTILTLAMEEVRKAQISVAIVDNAVLRDLNRRHLGHDYDTDVLSFLLEVDLPDADQGTKRAAPRGTGKSLEGEVIVSAEMAVHSAPRYGWPAESELALYLIHGLLHLTGYDDMTPLERRRMRRREADVLREIGLAPHRRTPQRRGTKRIPR